MDRVIIVNKGSALDYMLGQIDQFKFDARLYFLIFDPFLWAHTAANATFLQQIKSKEVKVCFSLFVPFIGIFEAGTIKGKTLAGLFSCLNSFTEKFPAIHLLILMLWKKLTSVDKAKKSILAKCIESEVWFEWAKFSSEQEALFESVLRTASKVNVVPDALVVDFYTLTENMKSLFSNEKVILHVHNLSLKHYYDQTFKSEGLEKVLLTDYNHSDWPMRTKVNAAEIRVLYLCQKSSATENSDENLPIEIHKKRLTHLAHIFNNVGAGKHVKLIYRRQNIPQYFKLNSEMLDFCRTLGIAVENGTRGSLFAHVTSSDFILSEYTSASQYVRYHPRRLIFRDDGYERNRHIETIEEVYRGDIDQKIMISESGVFGKLSEWLHSEYH